MNKIFKPVLFSVPARRYHMSMDGGGGNGAKTEQELLLEKIQGNVKTEIEKRGYQDKESVEKLMNTTLQGLNLDALRKYETETETLNTSVKNIATELEKVKNIRTGELGADPELLRLAVNKMISRKEDGSESDLELMMRSKGQSGAKEMVLNIRAAATMTTTNTVDENNYPPEMIESMNMLDVVVKKRRGTQYIFDIASRNVVSNLEQYTTWLEEGQEQGAFALVAEGAVKPLVSYALVRNFVKAQKVAAKTVITEEFAKFRAKIWTSIQDLITDKIIRDYSAILTGLLQAQAAGYIGTTLDDTIAIPTDYDAIGAVAAQIETLNFIPDILILNPQDKWRLALEKDSQNRYYMMIPMMGADGIVTMMGFRVITSTYQTPGSFTLGESGLFKIEEETLSVRLGYGIDVTTATVSGSTVVTAVKADFDSNQMRMIVETWFKAWIATNHLGSFVTASFATVKAALLKP